MNITRAVAACAIFACLAAVGFASPAWADDFSGTYTFQWDGGNAATWTVTPCGDQLDQCVHVSETGNSAAQPWSGDAHWSVGYWSMFVDRQDMITCDDGKKVPGRATYSWDAVTLSGTGSIFNTGVCGDEPGTLSSAFTLTKIGPAELPQS